MEEERDYYTRKVYKDGRPSEIVDEDLTREEAQALVREDIEENCGAEEYMLVFDSYQIMNTIENNKLIAEFMGFTYDGKNIGWYDNEEVYLKYSCHKENSNCFDEGELAFYTSWEWLMPVVERIYNVLDTIDAEDFRIKLHEQLLDLNLENLHKAVVEFIKWYNENKQLWDDM